MENGHEILAKIINKEKEILIFNKFILIGRGGCDKINPVAYGK